MNPVNFQGPTEGSSDRRLLSDLLATEQVAFGAWCSIPSPFVPEVLAAQNFDYIGIDCQHGLISSDMVWQMLQGLRGSNIVPLVRVAENDPVLAGHALDSGASGVIIPMIQSVEDAELAVASCRYAPDGQRSFGPTRARFLGDTDPTAVNEQVGCVIMIETLQGVESIEAICGTSGIDAVYVGPADLAVSMGISPMDAKDVTAHAEAIQEVLGTCIRLGIHVGIHCQNGTEAREYADYGFSMCTISTDVVLLRGAAQAELEVASARRSGS